MAGAFGLLVVLRSYRVATNSSYYNAVTADSKPFEHAGGTSQGTVGGSGGNTAIVPTEHEINTGSVQGSEAVNYLNRNAVIQLGSGNSYVYTHIATGYQYTYYIHTASLDAYGNNAPPYGYSTDPTTDGPASLPMGDLGNWGVQNQVGSTVSAYNNGGFGNTLEEFECFQPTQTSSAFAGNSSN